MIQRTAFILALVLFCVSNVVFAQNVQGDLTQLSMEDLMNIEVTSAEKKPEKYFTTPAAIYVITAQDIAHSTATSIPELLRMVPGVNVQRITSNTWTITIRGFNGLN